MLLLDSVGGRTELDGTRILLHSTRYSGKGYSELLSNLSNGSTFQRKGLQLVTKIVAIVSPVLSTTTLWAWAYTRYDKRILPKCFKCTFPNLANGRAALITKQQCRKSGRVHRGHYASRMILRDGLSLLLGQISACSCYFADAL
jgi:hypothetical protein